MTRAAKLSWKRGGGASYEWIKIDIQVHVASPQPKWFEIEMFSWWTGNIELRIGKFQFTHSVQTHAFGICMAPYFRADYRHTVEIILEGRKFSHIFTCLCECMETCTFFFCFREWYVYELNQVSLSPSHMILLKYW